MKEGTFPNYRSTQHVAAGHEQTVDTWDVVLGGWFEPLFPKAGSS